MRIAFLAAIVVLIAIGSVLIPWACGYTGQQPPKELPEKTVVVEKTVPVEKTIEVLPDTGGFTEMWVGAYNAPHHWYEPVGAVLIGVGVILASRTRFK